MDDFLVSALPEAGDLPVDDAGTEVVSDEVESAKSLEEEAAAALPLEEDAEDDAGSLLVGAFELEDGRRSYKEVYGICTFSMDKT